MIREVMHDAKDFRALDSERFGPLPNCVSGSSGSVLVLNLGTCQRLLEKFKLMHQVPVQFLTVH